MIFKKIDHVEIVPKNAETTIDFYVTILGFKIQSRKKMTMAPITEITYLELGGTVIEIIAADGPAPKSAALWEVGYRGLALEVTDMTKAVDYLQGKGVAIAVQPKDLGNSVRGEIRDPDGLIIELRQWK